MGAAASKKCTRKPHLPPPPAQAPAPAPAPPTAPLQPQQQQQKQGSQPQSLPRVESGASLKLEPMAPAEAKRWCVQIGGAKPEATYRLVCLHWAGGNSSIYRSWGDLGADVAVVAIELPGRQARMREPPIKKFEVIVQRIVQALQALGYLPTPDSSTPNTEVKPLMIFGHSFGAMLAIHITRLIREMGLPLPKLVFASGMLPLDDRGPPSGVSRMTDAGIVEHLVKMGGVPPEVAANRDLMNVFLPAIRGDYTAIDNYLYTDAPPLPCPLAIFAGQNDDRAPLKRMEGWTRFVTTDASRQFSLDVFPGGHFFVKEHTSLVLERVRQRIAGLAQQSSSS